MFGHKTFPHGHVFFITDYNAHNTSSTAIRAGLSFYLHYTIFIPSPKIPIRAKLVWPWLRLIVNKAIECMVVRGRELRDPVKGA